MIRTALDLDLELTALTAWEGPRQHILRRAQSSAYTPQQRRWTSIARALLRPRAAGYVGIVGIAAIIVFSVHWQVPPMASRGGRDFSRAVKTHEALRRAVTAQGIYSDDSLEWSPSARLAEAGRASPDAAKLAGLGYGSAGDQPMSAGTQFRYFYDSAGTSGRFVTPSVGDAEDAARNQPDSSSAAERFVIRKATMELYSSDVRTVFAKAQHAVSEADGEYVQDSTITGTGKDTQAWMTLRVAAPRLSALLNELRQLGEVRSENTTGEDVTAQVVDVEARLRNERRVEAELLELFDKRQDAPLKEVLELRDKLSQVRQGIEQLVAQRDRLSRLVSLATVLVIIRGKDAPVESIKPSILTYFADACGKAWTGGLRLLSDTIAGLLNVLVGGLVWWIALFAAVLLIRRRLRRWPTVK